jgi:alcohol dehydrogenase
LWIGGAYRCRWAANKLCGLPLNLSQAGVTEDKLGSIARAAINDDAISFSPVEVTCDEAPGVLRLDYDNFEQR